MSSISCRSSSGLAERRVTSAVAREVGGTGRFPGASGQKAGGHRLAAGQPTAGSRAKRRIIKLGIDWPRARVVAQAVANSQ
jgi:hypothetical protein